MIGRVRRVRRAAIFDASCKQNGGGGGGRGGEAGEYWDYNRHPKHQASLSTSARCAHY